jgi:hypothetical protein
LGTRRRGSQGTAPRDTAAPPALAGRLDSAFAQTMYNIHFRNTRSKKKIPHVLRTSK